MSRRRCLDIDDHRLLGVDQIVEATPTRISKEVDAAETMIERTEQRFGLKPTGVYEPGRDLYLCPQGNILKTTGRVHDGKTLLYRASKFDCDPCPLKLRCS